MYDTEEDFLEYLHDDYESLSNVKVIIDKVKYQTTDFNEYIKDFGIDSFSYAIDDLESMLDSKLIKNIEG